MKTIMFIFLIMVCQFCYSQNKGITDIFEVVDLCGRDSIPINLGKNVNYHLPKVTFWNTFEPDYPKVEFNFTTTFIFEQQFNDTILIAIKNGTYYCDQIKTNKSLSIVPKMFVFCNKDKACPSLVRFILKDSNEGTFFELPYGYSFGYITKTPDNRWFIEYSNNRRTYH